MTPTTGPPPAKDMVWVPGGGFLMGSEDFYQEERPVHRVEVDGFWIDAHPVTNAEFRRFVKATGHVTVAERPPDPADYPDADPTLLVPGALVFRPSSGPVDLRDWRTGGARGPGASWRHPEGPGSTLHGRERHPVVQVAYADALAYAAWAGKTLATEAEWEHAARGGLEGKVFCWGDEPTPRGRQMANTWQGEFPWQNLLLDRYARTPPVGVPAQRLRPGGHGQQRLGVDQRLLHPPPPRRGRAPLLCAPQPPGDRAGPGRGDPAPGDQGRQPPGRAELLPALPAGRPPGRGRGHLHRPHRVPLRRQGAMMGAAIGGVLGLVAGAIRT